MQFAFQGHPREEEKESLIARRFGKGQWKCGELQGCASVSKSLQLSSVGRRRGGGPGDPEQQRQETAATSMEETCVINHYVMNGDSPLGSTAYMWLVMAVVSMTICAATLM